MSGADNPKAAETLFKVSSDMDRGATLSPCGTYRYDLWRRWGPGPVVLWMMLNPSTADALVDDPTVRRCIGFTKAWGWGGMAVVNRYALRATDPKALVSVHQPGGPENARYWYHWFDSCVFAVAAWGSWSPPKRTPLSVELAWPNPIHIGGRANKPIYCLGTTKGGQPRHPLYVPAAQERVPWPARTDASEGSAS